MSDKERAFMGELKALLDKYEVTFAEDAVYYVGENPNYRFVFPGDDSNPVLVTIDDMADLRGGWK